MTAQKPAWYDAFRAFAVESLSYLKTTYGQPALMARPNFLSPWVRQSDTGFQLGLEYTWVGIPGAWQVLERQETYAAVRAALLADPVSSVQLDTLVGNALSQSRIDLDATLQIDLIYKMVDQMASFEFDGDIFDAAYNHIERFFVNVTVDFHMCVPLIGAALPPDIVVPLSNEVVVRRLTDEEIVQCLQAGSYPRLPMNDHVVSRVFIPREWQFGATASLALPKVSGPPHVPVDFPKLPPIADLIDRFVQAVRLVVGAGVARGLETTWTHIFGSGGSSTEIGVPIAPARGEPVHLVPEILADVIRCLASLRSGAVEKDKAIGVAIRRLADLPLRRSDEDVIVDLMIAAEALFLTDPDGKSDKGELRYRLALRGATFVTPPGSSPSAVHEFLKRAYNVRSVVVHGGKPKAKDIVGLLGEPTDLGRMVADLEHFMLMATRSAMAMRASGQEPYEWDERLMSRFAEAIPEVLLPD